MTNKKLLGIMMVGLALSAPVMAAEVDEDAAKSLMKKSGCFKCHAVDKKKDGPPYQEVAAKYKDKPDAEEKLFIHATTNPKVKIDGKEETHETLKTKDEAQIRNVVRWVLSR